MAGEKTGKIEIKEKPIITFLSDFGTQDGYTGSVKGVVKSIAPNCEILDITHDIKAFDIHSAAWTILNYYSSFPAGTVHLAVVDPGVGSRRHPVIIKAGDYFFAGPDNGIFSLAAAREDHTVYNIHPASVEHFTFHGRDIFAPAAAKLALGIHPSELGDKQEGRQHKVLPLFQIKDNYIETKAIAVDHFGNIVTGFHKDDFEALGKKRIKSVNIKNYPILGINKYYAERNPGELLVLWNSMNFLEIALNCGNAADKIGINKEQDKIIIKIE